MAARNVLILDDDEDLRVTMATLLQAMCGVDTVAVADVASLIQEGERALVCPLAILDINLGYGQPNGLDARAWLVDHGYTGQIVLLTGHAKTHPLVQQASAIDGVRIVQKPMDSHELCALVQDATR